MKKILVGFVFFFGLAFTLSIIYFSKHLLHQDDNQFETYWQMKDIQIAGKIISYDKASAKNKAFVLAPSLFQVNMLKPYHTASGFISSDSAVCILIAPLPSQEVDSLACHNQEVIYFKNHKVIAKDSIQLLRWNTIQRTQKKQELIHGKLTAF